MAARVSMDRRVYYFMPIFSPALAQLTVRRSQSRGQARRIAYTPIQPMPYMTGQPEERVYRIPPTHPTGFYLSPSGRRAASFWQGRATLPDGFSWPAYVFQFRVASLPR